MGVLNVTPDSFSDGGRFLDAAAAVEHAQPCWPRRAPIWSMSAENRPARAPSPSPSGRRSGAWCRSLEALGAAGIPFSIDTSKAEVARRALAAGACFLNDVTALRGDPAMAEVVAGSEAEVCLMHMLGQPPHDAREPQICRCS